MALVASILDDRFLRTPKDLQGREELAYFVVAIFEDLVVLFCVQGYEERVRGGLKTRNLMGKMRFVLPVGLFGLLGLVVVGTHPRGRGSA